MPYNTRRKSLSLPSLGIHVPVTHAARIAAANQKAESRGASPTSTSSSHASSHRHPSPSMTYSPTAGAESRPSKKAKRSHGSESSISSLPSADTTTPPPSPKPLRHSSVEMDGNETHTEIDMSSINDDIVQAVVEQLQHTGNRPHLVKELSAILMQFLKSVQQSANPCAIISSRLASYMKRPCWSTASPCPLAKELETVHPRRTYYFLTTCPHIPLPVAAATQFTVPRVSIVTPPLSSAASASESAEEERRRELSPSPEVDLSSPEFDDMDDDLPMPGTPMGGFFSVRFPRSSSHYALSRNQRGASPPLERDEKEFTQTAEGLQKRKLAGQAFPAASSSSSTTNSPLLFPADRDESFLFGVESRHLDVNSTGGMFSIVTSPAMRPTIAPDAKRESESESWSKLDAMLDWDRRPENIALEELDGLLDEC